MDTGVLPSQRLREAISNEWLLAGEWRIPDRAVQPASVDLRLGEHAWALRCSFLPDSHSSVEEKVKDLAFELSLADGLFLSLDACGPAERIVGYRAKKNSLPIDLSQVGALRWQEYWEPVHPEPGGRIVLEPEVFYLLLSAEGVSVPARYAAEMLAYDPTAGELRTHYAGFFDPGFGYSRARDAHGARAALEVRARDVSFMVEHRQPVCKLAFERTAGEPDVLYGEEVGSSYQHQQTMLSKHFREHAASLA